jgi:hypothetical protein
LGHASVRIVEGWPLQIGGPRYSNGAHRYPSLAKADLIGPVNFHRAAFKVGPFLNGKRLVLNIANDMRPRLQNDVSPLDLAFDFPVPNDSFGDDSAGDMSLARDYERSAAQFALDLPIDLY